ncbi:MAG: DUF1566 domain-containing protein [Treponema sp.]|nr:DUF1566 domain-containing protein [Treponema sp.]
MKKYTFFAVSIVLLLAGMLIVSACFSPFQGDKGTFTLSLGGSPGSSRAAVPWMFGMYSEDLEHSITLSGGPGPDQTVSVRGDQPVQFSVTPGTWEIDVEGWRPGTLGHGRPISMGYSKVTIRAGQNGGVPIKMFVYCELGHPAPPELLIQGTVFYLSKEGFVDVYSGKTCHYLAAHTMDLDNPGGTPPLDLFEWGLTTIDVPDTRTGIGTGFHNTMQMEEFSSPAVFALRSNPMLSTGGGDWYIPSRDELNLLYQNRNYLAGIGIGTDTTYWSSSQSSVITNAYVQNLVTGVQGQMTKDNALKIRPIQAF